MERGYEREIIPKYLYSISIHTILDSKKGHFSLQNLSFCKLKWPFLQCKTACIAKSHVINRLQSWLKRPQCLNYFYTQYSLFLPSTNIRSDAQPGIIMLRNKVHRLSRMLSDNGNLQSHDLRFRRIDSVFLQYSRSAGAVAQSHHCRVDVQVDGNRWL